MAETEHMTADDLLVAAPLTQQIYDIVTKERPTVAVAACACALAAVAHLAGCGPRAAAVMFEHFYKKFDEERGKKGL